MNFLYIAALLFISVTTSALANSKKLVKAVESAKGDSESIKTIQNELAAGADPNSVDDDGDSAIRWSIYNNNPKVLEMLLAAGANPNSRYLKHELKDWTPLMDATAEAVKDDKYDRLVGILVKHNAEINANKDGITALMLAVTNAKSNSQATPRVIEFLLRKGANPNLGASPSPKVQAISPLMKAAQDGKTGIVKVLLKYKARSDVNGPGSKTAADFANSSGHPEIAKLLEHSQK
jgi:ankyrin repeat protein